MALIYLLLFASPQLLLYLYLRERLPLSARRWLTLVFIIFNVPWGIVAVRMFSGSLWGISRVPYIAPWIAWQLLGWIFCGLVALYILAKGLRRASDVVRERLTGNPDVRRTTDDGRVSRRQFLARATYAYAAAGLGVSAYGIWSAESLPALTRRTLLFPDLPTGLDGLRIAHLSDVHAGIHMSEEKMRAIVAQTNALGADLIVQTGDMIDISQSYIPDYVRAFRDLHAPLGVVTVLGNHDRYTGEDAVIRGVRDAGQVFVKNGAHVIPPRRLRRRRATQHSPHPRRPHPRRPVLLARRRLVTGPADHEVRDGALHAGSESALCESGNWCGGRTAAGVCPPGDRIIRTPSRLESVYALIVLHAASITSRTPVSPDFHSPATTFSNACLIVASQTPAQISTAPVRTEF